MNVTLSFYAINAIESCDLELGQFSFILNADGHESKNVKIGERCNGFQQILPPPPKWLRTIIQLLP